MGNKALTVHFYAIEKLVGADTTLLPRNELELALKAISKLKVNRKEAFGRYYFDGADERCLMFHSDEGEIPKPKKDTYIPGLFIKRRTSNYPYENNDIGKLFQIQLSSEGNELAEVTFFIIDTSLRVLLFVSNPYVGSVSSFGAYLNNRLKEYDKAIESLPFFIDDGFVRFEFPPIINETPEDDFNLMNDISTFEMHIAGSINLLETTFSQNKGDSGEALKNMAFLAKKARSRTIKFVLSSGRTKEKMDKAEIKGIFKKMAPFFRKSKQDNKFIVKGKIDDEVRFLDLLNAEYFYKTSFGYEGRYVPLDGVFKRLYPIMDKYRNIFIKKNGFKEDDN